MSGNHFPAELYHFVEPTRPCSYLPDQHAALEYRSYAGLTPAQLEQLLSRGWRRFGIDVFRPACRHCRQCIPLRIPVEQFRPSKSQRRVLRRNQHIKVTLHQAGVSPEHVRLYNAWHAEMTRRSHWQPQVQTLQSYAQSFLMGDFPSLHELRYFSGSNLIGVGLIDCLPDSLSSVYFYHDPAWRELSPGTFSLLCEIDLARRLNLSDVYLGYWIGGCPSMAYKNRFEPHELLLSRPTDDDIPVWESPPG